MSYFKQKNVRLLGGGLLLTLFLLFSYLAIVPFGKITYKTDWQSPSYFISKPKPAERFTMEDKGFSLIGQPLYLEIFPPRNFQKITISLEHNASAEAVEIGIRHGAEGWHYEKKPLYVKILDELIQDKDKNEDSTIYNEGVLFWQRPSAEKKFSSLEEFLAAELPSSLTAVYNYDLPFGPSSELSLSEAKSESEYESKLESDFQSSSLLDEEVTWSVGLRGDYSFLTSSDGSPLSFNFSWRDEMENELKDEMENKTGNEDSANSVKCFFKVLLFADRTLVKEEEWPLEQGFGTFLTTDLSSGVYRLEVRASDLVVTEKISTRQAKVSFLNRLSLSGEDRNNFILYTDSETLNAQTSKAASRQNISFGEFSLPLERTFEQFSVHSQDFSRLTRPITLTKDDLIITGDGVFAWSEESLFNPLPYRFTPSLFKNSSDFSYLVANYESKTKEKNKSRKSFFKDSQDTSSDLTEGFDPTKETTFVSETEFLLPTERGRFGEYSLMLALPEDSLEEDFRVYSLAVTFEGGTIFDRLRVLWQRLMTNKD